jgi:hypothetical protein
MPYVWHMNRLYARTSRVVRWRSLSSKLLEKHKDGAFSQGSRGPPSPVRLQNKKAWELAASSNSRGHEPEAVAGIILLRVYGGRVTSELLATYGFGSLHS